MSRDPKEKSSLDIGRNLADNKKALVSGWGKITTTTRDALRKLEFGTNARSLRYVAIPIANKVCSEDEEIKKISTKYKEVEIAEKLAIFNSNNYLFFSS